MKSRKYSPSENVENVPNHEPSKNRLDTPRTTPPLPADPRPSARDPAPSSDAQRI